MRASTRHAIFGTMAGLFGVAGIVALVMAINHADDVRERKERDMVREAWEGNCHDTSTLVATTAGSPNAATCTNKHHRMHVEPVTKASNEEIGALVFCQCIYDDAGAE